VGIKFGAVSEIDAAKGLARVTFGDNEAMQSWWLHVLAANTQDNKAYAMPDIGEGVACLVDDHCENGVILGAVYSQVDGPPVADSNKVHMSFKDGTWLEYDREQHKLTGSVQGAVELAATGDIKLHSAQVLTLEAAKLLTIRTPRLRIEPLEAEQMCEAEAAVDWELIGRLRHIGQYEHTGDQSNEGSITATGAIMDSAGNTNHHVH
jgi:phage baseplate assembly protein V